MGSEADAKDRGHAGPHQCLARPPDGMVRRPPSLADGSKDAPVPEVRATVVQLNGLLADTRTSLKRWTRCWWRRKPLAPTHARPLPTRPTRRGGKQLRGGKPVNEINRKWPFTRNRSCNCHDHPRRSAEAFTVKVLCLARRWRPVPAAHRPRMADGRPWGIAKGPGRLSCGRHPGRAAGMEPCLRSPRPHGPPDLLARLELLRCAGRWPAGV